MSTVENDLAAHEDLERKVNMHTNNVLSLAHEIVEEVRADSPSRTSDVEMGEIIEACDTDIDEPLRVLWETGNAKPLLDLLNKNALEIAQYAADEIITKGLTK
jgi:hypothetical protein